MQRVPGLHSPWQEADDVNLHPDQPNMLLGEARAAACSVLHAEVLSLASLYPELQLKHLLPHRPSCILSTDLGRTIPQVTVAARDH